MYLLSLMWINCLSILLAKANTFPCVFDSTTLPLQGTVLQNISCVACVNFPLLRVFSISIQTCWNISHLKKKIYFLTRVVTTCYRHFSISYSPFNSFQSGFLPHSCTETVLGNFTSNLHVLKSTGQFWVLYLNSSRLLFSNYSIILEALSSLGFWVIQNCEWYSSSGSLLNLLFSRPLNMTESQDSVPSPQTSSLYSVLGYVTYPFALNAN